MAYDRDKRSERLLQGRRFTTDDLTLTQEAFTDVFDLGAGEIFSDDGLIPTGSTQIPFSGSSQNGLIVSASVVNPSISTDLPILKYHHRKKLKPAADGNREVYYFTTSTGSAGGVSAVTSDQLIEADQQTNFISPKYISVAADSVKSTEANPPGYKVVVYKDDSPTVEGIDTDAITDDKYVFDYKTGVLTWESGQQPASDEFVYMSVYQYVGRTIRSQIDDGTILQNVDSSFGSLDVIGNITASGDISSSITSTGSFGNIQIPDDGRITIGDSGDLQLYHNGNHSIIEDNGTGNLILLTNLLQVKNAANNQTMIQANQGGAVKLLHNNSQKFITTTDGINVTGDISASGDLDIDGNITGSGLVIGDKSGKHASIDDGSLIISGGDAWIKSDNAGGESFLYLGSNQNNGNKLMYISTKDDGADNMNFSIGRYTHKWSFIGGGNTNGSHTAFEIYGQDSTSEQDFSRLRLFSPDGTTRAQIHTSGSVYFNPEGPDDNFGIGTTSPNNKFHVKSNDNVLARFESNTDDAKIIIKDNDTQGYHNVRDGYHSFGFDGFTTRAALFVVSSSKDSNDVYGKVGIGTKGVSDKVLTIKGDISASGNLHLAGGNIFLQQNITGDNYLIYDLTKDHIEIKSQDIHLNSANGVGVGEGGHSPGSFFANNGNTLNGGSLVNITGSFPGELHFGNNEIGGADGTDEISGSTIGAIAFSGRTEFKRGSLYNPINTSADGLTGSHDSHRLLAHIRGGTEVHLIPDDKDEPHVGKTRTGGFLAFHTAFDSSSYAGDTISMGANERMRINRVGNVGIGYTHPRFRLQVDDRIAISSSAFFEGSLGPSLHFRGLRSGSGVSPGNDRLPEFIVGQVKAGAIFSADGSELPGGDQSASFEIRARKIDDGQPLDNGTGTFNGDLIAFHIRTYERENNPTLSELASEGFNANNFPHKGANFGFNTNNPDGFNVNTRISTFGLGGTNTGDYSNIINFRGDIQLRSEGEFYTIEDNAANIGLAPDFVDYVYDEQQPPGDGDDGDGNDDGDGGEEIPPVDYGSSVQLNSPNGHPVLQWVTPDERSSVQGSFLEIPLGWSWTFGRRISRKIFNENIEYSATGSILSGSLENVADNSNFTRPFTIWSASRQNPYSGNDPFKWVETRTLSHKVTGFFAAQKSASHDPASRFPTFPDNGDYLNERETYKWRLELNRVDGQDETDAPTKLIVTSSARFKYYDGITGDGPGEDEITPTVLLGDTNDNGTVDVLDVVQIVNHLLNVEQVAPFNLTNADVNQDGNVNVLDVIAITHNILGSIDSNLEEMNKRGYNVVQNKIFNEKIVEKKLFKNLNDSLLFSNGVTLTGSTSLGNASAVSSSLRSFVTSSNNFLRSGSNRTSITLPYKNFVKPKLGSGFGKNFIKSHNDNEFNLNGIIEGSTLLFNNSFEANVTDVFLTSSRRVKYVKLDRELPQSMISGAYYREFVPRGFYSGRPTFTNRGKIARQDKGLIIRQSDNKIGVGTSKPTAMLHISSSISSSGLANETLLKIERDDGAKFEITDTEQIFKDQKGNVSRRKFDSLGKEVFLSGSKDSTASENNAITLDQTGDSARITLSGSTVSNTELGLISVNPQTDKVQFAKMKPNRIQFTTIGSEASSFSLHHNYPGEALGDGLGTTGSGIFQITPRSVFDDEARGLNISSSTGVTMGHVGINKFPDENTLSVNGTGSFAGLVIGGGTFTSASLAAGGGGGSGNVNSSKGVDNRLAVFTGASDIEGEEKLTFDGDILRVQGNITASGDISASGNISASGDIHASNVIIPPLGKVFFNGTSDTDDYINYSSTFDTLFITSQDINLNPLNGVGINRALNYNNIATLDVDGDINATSHITASGDISASGGTITANKLVTKAAATAILTPNITVGDGSDHVRFVGTTRGISGAAASSANNQFFLTSPDSANADDIRLVLGRSTAPTNDDKILTVAGSISASGNLHLETNLKMNATAGQDIDLSDTSEIDFGRFGAATRIRSNTDGDLFVEADNDLHLAPDDDLVIEVGSTRHTTFFGEGRARINSTITTAPTSTLEVVGDISASGGFTGMKIISDRTSDDSNIQLQRQGTTKGTLLTNNTLGKEFEIFSSGDLIFNESGGDNVGIGMASPEYKLDVAGDIRAQGDVIADNYIVSSSLTYVTTSFSNGSTIFGDTLDDTHDFSGSLNVVGNITASGNISSSGKVNASEVQVNGTSVVESVAGSSTQGVFTRTKAGSDASVVLTGLRITDSPTFNDISASGGISASGTITGNSLTVTGNITANGNIVGDDGTEITNIATIGLQSIAADANGNTVINMNTNDITFEPNAADALTLEQTKVTIGSDMTAGLVVQTNITASGDISVSGDIFNTQTIQMTAPSASINSFNTSSHQTCKYVLQVTSASFIQSSEMLVMQNGSNAFNTEYAQMNSGLNLLDFTTKVVGPNVELIGSGSFISCSVKFNRTLI